MSVSEPVPSPPTAPLTPAVVNERPSSVRHAVLGAACLLAILTYLLRVGFNSVARVGQFAHARSSGRRRLSGIRVMGVRA